MGKASTSIQGEVDYRVPVHNLHAAVADYSESFTDPVANGVQYDQSMYNVPTDPDAAGNVGMYAIPVAAP